jgi:ATP-dependent exoDNAse (exonuclease V) beta subunit
MNNAIEIVRRTLGLPEIKAAKRARRLFRAVPVAGNTAGGRALGTVDLLFETQHGWQLVDFKTDREPKPETLKRYSTQMSSYAEVLSAVLRQAVTPSLCFVRSGQLVECT